MPPPDNTCQAILRDALQQLEDRRERLRPFVAELKEADKAIGVIERALGIRKAKAERAKADGPSPRAKFKQRILAELEASLEPLTTGDFAARLGRDDDDYLAHVLDNMIAAGTIIKVDGHRFGLPSAIREVA